MNIAIGYVRSSPRENQTMLGPEAQREAIKRLAAKEGLVLDDALIFDDIDVSGGDGIDKRPGLLAALDAIKERGAVALLAAKRDRIARDVILAVVIEREVKKAKARLLTADGVSDADTPEATLMRRIFDAFAEYERLLIKARTRNALAVKKRKGERVGDPPFGYKLAPDGQHSKRRAESTKHPASCRGCLNIIPDKAEAEVIRSVIMMRGAGESYAAIAATLNERGVPARGGGWHDTTLKRLVKRQEVQS